MEKRAIDVMAACDFLREQMVKETGAFSKGVNKGLQIAYSALCNEQILPSLTATAPVPPEQNPKHKEGICPVCGGQFRYGEFELSDNGGCYEWDCPHCGASGEEGYDLVFDGNHYNVEDAEGNEVDI